MLPPRTQVRSHMEEQALRIIAPLLCTRPSALLDYCFNGLTSIYDFDQPVCIAA